jgi:hypothetical protein
MSNNSSDGLRFELLKFIVENKINNLPEVNHLTKQVFPQLWALVQNLPSPPSDTASTDQSNNP